MFFLKWIILLVILIISIYIGILKSRSYENRVIELNKFQNALVMFKSKIEFTYEPLKNIFEDISNVIYGDDCNIFSYTIQNDNNIYESWKKAVDKINSNFSKNDKEIIKMMGKLLGKTDIKGQVSEIELTKELIQKQIEQAELEKNKNVKLYKTMGIVLGLGICIILI